MQLGDLNDPDTAHLHRGIFTAEVGKLVGEVLLSGEDLYGGGFPDACLSFEHQDVISLAAGLKDARDGGNQKSGAGLHGKYIRDGFIVFIQDRWRHFTIVDQP